MKRQNLNALFESLRLARINKKLKYYHEIDLWLFGNTNIFFFEKWGKNKSRVPKSKQNKRSNVQASRWRKLVPLLRHLASRAWIAWRRPTVSDADSARAVSSETDGLAGQESLVPIVLASPVFLKQFIQFIFKAFINYNAAWSQCCVKQIESDVLKCLNNSVTKPNILTQ